MFHLAEYLGSSPTPLWKLVKQAGVDYVVGTLPFAETAKTGAKAWDYLPLLQLKQRYADAGLTLAVLESRPPMDKVKLGLPGRDQQIEDVKLLLRHMGAVGIPVWCYEFMAVHGWLRTSTMIPARGGALVTGYDHRLMQKGGLTDAGVVTEQRLWDNYAYFLERVLPVTEDAKVKLALHPDDPPLSPIRGVGRIMRSIENFDRALKLADSPYHGITLCQGNFRLMTDDLPAAIRHFGKRRKIFFAHFRDVRGTPRKFVETFHDDGPTDMLACLKAYHDVGFDGVIRPDHVPTLEGDSNEMAGYSTMGRLFAIGYIKGLNEAIVGKHGMKRAALRNKQRSRRGSRGGGA